MITGCYSPSLRDCELACAAGDRCPSGFECRGNLCRAEGSTGTCAVDDAGIADAEILDGNPNLDTDTDSVNDALDNCRLVSNSDQANEDMDEFGDACDPCPPRATAAANMDSDSDGVGDGCDPFPTMGGDRIRFFEGFNGPPSGVTTMFGSGNWSYNGRATVVTSADVTAGLLFDLVRENGRREYVSSQIEILSFRTTSQPRTAGIVTGYDPGNNRGATCAIGLNNIGTPSVMLVETGSADLVLASKADSSGSGGVSSPILLNPHPTGAGFQCATPTGGEVEASPVLGSNDYRVGLRSRSLTAAYSWFMVVDSPVQ